MVGAAHMPAVGMPVPSRGWPRSGYGRGCGWGYGWGLGLGLELRLVLGMGCGWEADGILPAVFDNVQRQLDEAARRVVRVGWRWQVGGVYDTLYHSTRAREALEPGDAAVGGRVDAARGEAQGAEQDCGRVEGGAQVLAAQEDLEATHRRAVSDLGVVGADDPVHDGAQQQGARQEREHAPAEGRGASETGARKRASTIPAAVVNPSQVVERQLLRETVFCSRGRG